MSDDTPQGREPPIAGLYPSVLLGDGQWERVITALRKRGTKADDAIAERIDKRIQRARRHRLGRESSPS